MGQNASGRTSLRTIAGAFTLSVGVSIIAVIVGVQ